MFCKIREYLAYLLALFKHWKTPNVRIDKAYIDGSTVYVKYGHPKHSLTAFTSPIDEFCNRHDEYDVFEKRYLHFCVFCQEMLNGITSLEEDARKQVTMLLRERL